MVRVGATPGVFLLACGMFFIFHPELIMNVPVAVAIAIGLIAFALPVAGIFFIPKLAAFLKKKGLDDETLEFIDLIDDYFDEAEAFAESSGIKGAAKLTRALTGLVKKLGRELKPTEKALAEKRFSKLAAMKKGSYSPSLR